MSNIISFPAINEGVKNPFRWYLNPKRRNSYRRVCKGECPYKLWTPARALLPFQLYTTMRGPYTITWNIYDANGNLYFSPNTSTDPPIINVVGLVQQDVGDNLYYFYYKGDDIGKLLTQGFYTSEITITDEDDNTVTWYSEEFYSIGFCAQGTEIIADPDLCSMVDWEFAGDGDSSTEPDNACSYCLTGASGDSTMTYPSAFPLNLGYYAVSIKVTGVTSPITVDCGGGDQLTITEDGSHTFYVNSAVDEDLIITIPPMEADPVCFDFISVQSLEEQELSDCHIKLSWWNDCGTVGEIYYGDTGYVNELWLEELCEILPPEQKILIESVENGEKDITPTFQKRTTIYTIELDRQTPQVVEALNEMVLHKFIQITLPSDDNNEVSYIKNVVIKNEYTEELGGCYGETSMSFELDDTTVQTGCCDEAEEAQITCVENNIIDGEDFADSSLWNIGDGFEWIEYGDPDIHHKFCFEGATAGILELAAGAPAIIAGNMYRITASVIIDPPGISPCTQGSVIMHIGGHAEILNLDTPTTFEFTATVTGECYFEHTGDCPGCIFPFTSCRLDYE